MSVAIRDGTSEDMRAIHAIEVASFADPWSEGAFRSMLAHPQVRLRVAVREGDVAGYSIAWILDDECELANLAVAPSSRRAGAGGALLDDLIAEVERRGGGTIWLEVRASNAAARALYESRGFSEMGRRKGYYRAPVEDAVLMRRAPTAVATER